MTTVSATAAGPRRVLAGSRARPSASVSDTRLHRRGPVALRSRWPRRPGPLPIRRRYCRSSSPTRTRRATRARSVSSDHRCSTVSVSPRWRGSRTTRASRAGPGRARRYRRNGNAGTAAHPRAPARHGCRTRNRWDGGRWNIPYDYTYPPGYQGSRCSPRRRGVFAPELGWEIQRILEARAIGFVG